MPLPDLTRKHYKRMRWYFQSPNGAASMADQTDLDLAAHGYIERANSVRYNGVVHFFLTRAGIAELSAENQREIERRRPHHHLAGRLAEWVRSQGRVTWENIEFVVDKGENQARQRVRPDVFSVQATMNAARICPHVHEVKVSRADFLADVAKPEKREGYRGIAEQIYYVAPAGMIEPSEVPEGCGLIEEVESAFRVSKKAVRQHVNLTPSCFMNLIIKPGAVNPL